MIKSRDYKTLYFLFESKGRNKETERKRRERLTAFRFRANGITNGKGQRVCVDLMTDLPLSFLYDRVFCRPGGLFELLTYMAEEDIPGMFLGRMEEAREGGKRGRFGRENGWCNTDLREEMEISC